MQCVFNKVDSLIFSSPTERGGGFVDGDLLGSLEQKIGNPALGTFAVLFKPLLNDKRLHTVVSNVINLINFGQV